MGYTLTGSREENEAGSFIDHRAVCRKTSRSASVVFIVDPDRALCEKLESLVQCEGWHAQSFASAEDFLDHLIENTPACLILDVFLPGLSGLQLQKRLAAERPHIATIFLSANDDIPTAVEAMKVGAIQFLTKPFQNDELLGAVREAFERSRVVLARDMEKQSLRKCYASLSLRQQQVMILAASGMLNKQIGGKLGISEITVKAHRGQVMQKMQANSFAELIKMAAKLGLSRAKESHRPRNEDSVSTLPGMLPGAYRRIVSEAACLR